MSGIIQQGIETLIRNELLTFLVFALIMATVFGILQNINLFGEDSKRYNIVIAIVFGLLAVLPHYIMPGSPFDIIPILQRALPQTMLLLIAVLGVLILLGLIGIGDLNTGTNNWLKWVTGAVLFILVAWIFVGSMGALWRLPYWLSPDLIAGIVALAIFGLIVAFIMKDDPSEGG